jgi:hypothetical protein
MTLPRRRFNTLPLSATGLPLQGPGFALHSQARRMRQAESSSSSYGLVVHLLLLPTPPRGDAVTVGYGPESVCPELTFTTLTLYAHRRTSAAA